jgi:hypothetical protein
VRCPAAAARAARSAPDRIRMRWFVKAGVQTVWGVAMFAIAGYMLLFVYNQWAEYADGVRHWEAAACRAVDATVEPCDKATSDCKGFCVLMKVLYAVGASATAAKGRPVAIARSGECEFSTKCVRHALCRPRPRDAAFGPAL